MSKKQQAGEHKPWLPIHIRNIRDSDWAAIKDSWKKSYRHALSWLEDEHYFRHIGRRIDELRTKARWSVAVDPNDHEFIFGWACFGTTAVHYVYVRQVFRRAKVAERLVLPGPWVPCTHWTRACEEYEVKKPGRLAYTPRRLPLYYHERLCNVTKQDKAKAPEGERNDEPVRNTGQHILH